MLRGLGGLWEEGKGGVWGKDMLGFLSCLVGYGELEGERFDGLMVGWLVGWLCGVVLLPLLLSTIGRFLSLPSRS